MDQKIGICWYTPDQWLRMRQVATDADCLQDTCQEWLEDAERMLKREGVKARQVYVNADDFNWWCKKNGLPSDGRSRSEYVSKIMTAGDEGDETAQS